MKMKLDEVICFRFPFFHRDVSHRGCQNAAMGAALGLIR